MQTRDIKHLLDGTEPGGEGVLRLARRALDLRAGAAPKRFPGTRLGAVFLAPSLRTRTSLEAACAALGVHPIVLQPGSDAWALEHRAGVVMDGAAAEHVQEAVGVLSGYVDVLAVRCFAGLTDADDDRADPVLSAFVQHSRGPVLSLESARYHPLQGLADTATWLSRLGTTRRQRLTLSWAPHPRALPLAVPHQVLTSAALAGMDVTVAHPEGFDLDPMVVERAGALAAASGGRVTVRHDRAAALDGAQVVYAKSWSGWSGYRDRAGEAQRRAALGEWQVRPADLGPATGFMHCLPVRRNVVVADAVLDGAHSWVQEQANLRLWTAMAALEEMLDGGATWSA